MTKTASVLGWMRRFWTRKSWQRRSNRHVLAARVQKLSFVARTKSFPARFAQGTGIQDLFHLEVAIITGVGIAFAIITVLVALKTFTG